MNDMQPVFRATNVSQAEFLVKELARAGIAAIVTDASSEFAHNTEVGPLVLVTAADERAAQAIVAEFQREIAADADRVVQAAHDSPALENWHDWPRCPECNAQRYATCPICHATGSAFPLADFIPVKSISGTDVGQDVEPAYDDTTVMLRCEACDEAFAPRFDRYCHDCGHNFENGVAIQRVEPMEFGSRAAIVLFATVALLAGLFVFFAFVLR